jgi:hypothetical protein
LDIQADAFDSKLIHEERGKLERPLGKLERFRLHSGLVFKKRWVVELDHLRARARGNDERFSVLHGTYDPARQGAGPFWATFVQKRLSAAAGRIRNAHLDPQATKEVKRGEPYVRKG